MNVEHHSITSASGEYTRAIQLLRGPEHESHRLCLFLDGEHYWRDLDAIPIVDGLRQSGALPPMTYLFVSHVSREARHADYACNDRYANFIAVDVVRWARENIAGVRAGGNVICGLSLSGLAATHIALGYNKVFSYLLSQSGSFWWNKEWLATNANPPAPVKSRFWISVGDKETATEVTHQPTGLFQGVSQITGAENIARKLESLGGTVHYHLFDGHHAAAPWKEELAPALKWLMKIEA